MKAFMKSIGGAHLFDPRVEFNPPSDYSLVDRASQLLPFGTDLFSRISVKVNSSGGNYWVSKILFCIF